MAPRKSTRQSGASTFARDAEAPPRGLLLELVGYLQASRKWWLTPLVLALMIASVFVLLGSTAAAPLIYTLF